MSFGLPSLLPTLWRGVKGRKRARGDNSRYSTPFTRRRSEVKKTLFAALAAAAVLAMPAAHAAETSVVKAIQACNADFFKAVAADKNIPESLKVRDGDMAYL